MTVGRSDKPKRKGIHPELLLQGEPSLSALRTNERRLNSWSGSKGRRDPPVRLIFSNPQSPVTGIDTGPTLGVTF